ncbi:MAG: 4-(cytidine 5'-diphospho)-2-C-methyl-D-erythritol kinase [Alphaproteobacteria bacterium]|nr:4-(cytidine 5'-diphospho)-2-C-methyl-D-erythritol kinase [Alphaproteobacteria bacterium]
MADRLSEFAKAKINLALHVLGRRADGFHELDSIVGFAEIGDRLTLQRADTLSLVRTGPFSADVPMGEDNIIVKTWRVVAQILKTRQVVLPSVKVVLEKNLPVASGMGGGSADAAAMVRGLLRLTQQKLSCGEIKSLAQSLGADVPVCMSQTACLMQGIGEKITPLNIALPRAIVLINPLLECSTPDVFGALGLAKGQSFKSPIFQNQPQSWRNDLTEAALKIQPSIKDVLSALEKEPAFLGIRMSGSGATCFGLMVSEAQASAAAARLAVKNPGWWVRSAALS